MSGLHLAARRRVLHALAGLALAGMTAPLRAAAAVPLAADQLSLRNLHTEETVVVSLPAGAAPDDEMQRKLQRVLRDHRSGDEHAIDVALFRQLLDLAAEAGAEARYEIISGYRAPVTNAALRERSTGVSEKSLHMEGRALDVRLVGVDCLKLAELARAQRRGGVGYYARSAFVHLDTGRVRTWDG